MKAKVAAPIETRHGGEGCSYQCPQIQPNRHQNLSVFNLTYVCKLYGTLAYPVGFRCPQRSPKCVENELPGSGPKPKAVKLKGPTSWDRLSKGGPIP